MSGGINRNPVTEALDAAKALIAAVNAGACPPNSALLSDFVTKMNVVITNANAQGDHTPLLPTDGSYTTFVQQVLTSLASTNGIVFTPCDLTKVLPPPPPPVPIPTPQPVPQPPAAAATGLSTGAMVAIGVGVAAAVALGVYLVVYKPHGGRKSNPIAELGEGSAARRRAGKKAWAKKKAEARARGKKSVKVFGDKRVRI